VPKFRERPKEVEAIRWDGTHKALAAIERLTGQTDILGPGESLTVDGPEGPSVVRLGWWVVKGDAGVRGCPPERFAKRYEEAPAPSRPDPEFSADEWEALLRMIEGVHPGIPTGGLVKKLDAALARARELRHGG
jgi:hypothetical protein